jgi:hypothetical protein
MRNLKQSLWVLALGISFTGLSTTSLAAAVPAQQDQDQYRNQDQDRNDNQRGARWYFQQGLQDGRHDRQYGGNRSDHQQPRNSNALSVYRDGYNHGFRNIPTNEPQRQGVIVNYFEQGLRDGQSDRQTGASRTDHPQPSDSNDLSAYRDGYKHGYRNIPTNQREYPTRVMNYFDQGLQDGRHDRQYGGNRSDHQQPRNSNDLSAYRDGYKHANNGNYDNPNNGNNNYTSRGDNQPEYLPAGTRLAILTNEQIDSNTANTNQVYSGQVNQDVTDNAGEIIISRGSPAELVIRTFSSGSDMTLDVQAINVNGRRYRISTAPLRQTGRNGLGMNKRTAEMVGGGALIGTIIGAVVGHGEGAAIGAAVGAAGGAGAQALTKGKQVSIPAETVLTFSLNNSVTLAPDEQ